MRAIPCFRWAVLMALMLLLTACALPGEHELDFPDEPAPGVPGPWLPGASPTVRGRAPQGCAMGAGGPGSGGRDPGPSSLNTPIAVGWTSGGEIALFDTSTGAAAALAGGASPGGERDLVLDPWLSRVLAYEGSGAAGAGEIVSYPLPEGDGASGDGGAGREGRACLSLGPRRHEGWVNGTARLAASPFGALVLEAGEAPRWTLLDAGGAATQSVTAPGPASLVTSLLPDGRFRISALTYGPSGEMADLRIALVDQGGVSEPVTVPLTVSPLSTPLTTRRVESAGGGQLIDVSDGEIVVSTFAGGGWPAWLAAGVGPGISRIEQAISMPGGERLALLTAGAVDVVIVTLGGGGAPQCAAALDLPGEPAEAGGLFTRGLVALGEDRLLAATSSGVFALSLSGDCPPRLGLDPAFDGGGLRGPIDGLP